MNSRLPKTCFAWDATFADAPEDWHSSKGKTFSNALNIARPSGTPVALRRFAWNKASNSKNGIHKLVGLFAILCLIGFRAAAETTNNVAATTPMPIPDVGASLIRVFGALAIVIAVFLAGVWLVRNWQRLTIHRGKSPKLNVVEVRSLGGRHAIYVVAYQQERFLLSASPGGVNLLSHLQPSDEDPAVSSDSAPQASFGQTLAKMLKGK